MKKIVSVALTLLLMCSLAGCGNIENNQANSNTKNLYDVCEQYPNARILRLDGNSAKLDGNGLKEYDYIWTFDPSMSEPEYSGEETDANECYIAHDIIFYPEIDESCFAKENYDGETEWVTHYTAEGMTDYLFSTLPVLGNELPKNMMHSKEEAYANPVLHITEPGEYILEGEWNGQIYIDLGDKDECFTDDSKKVTLILNGVDVECTVAPSVVFYSLYECDNEWESRATSENSVDTSNAGAKVVLVDGTENNFSGANVYRLLKAKYKNDDSKVQKKYYKMDGGFYSYVSMEIEGSTGIMNIIGSTFEGLDSELHLTINGGYVNIVSQDDGINVNEDHVSVFTLNGGRLTIFAGQGAEGDVIDSNGYIDINGGIIAGASPSVADNMLDSEDGTFVDDKATVIENVAGIKGGMMRPDNPQGGFNQGSQQDDFNPGDLQGKMPPDNGDRPEPPDKMPVPPEN